jgi:hypothetical protein
MIAVTAARGASNRAARLLDGDGRESVPVSRPFMLSNVHG